MKRYLFSTGMSKFLIALGAAIMIGSVVLFAWREYIFDIELPISKQNFGLFGDFVSGVVGSMWALAGVILFYVALTEQRNDFRTNREALRAQIEALNLQAQEFKNQREELTLSRHIFREQSRTIKKQQFDTTFFSFLKLRSDIILQLPKEEVAIDYFSLKRDLILKDFILEDSPEKTHKAAIQHYMYFYYAHKKELSHYFRSIYRIMRFIDESDLEDEAKHLYAKIFRSQLTENELFFLFYNAHTPYGLNFRYLILKYNLLKHLPVISKMEFKSFSTDGDNKIESRRLHYCEQLNNFLGQFLHDAKKNRIEILGGQPQAISLHLFPDGPIYELNADSLTHMIFGVHCEGEQDFHAEQLGLPVGSYIAFQVQMFHDILIFSRFKDPEALDIVPRKNGKRIEFSLNSNAGFDVSTDAY